MTANCVANDNGSQFHVSPLSKNGTGVRLSPASLLGIPSAFCTGSEPRCMQGTWTSLLLANLLLKDTTALDLALLLRTVKTISWLLLDHPNNLQTLNNVAKHNVPAVQPWGFLAANEELTAIRVRACVRHTNYALADMLKSECFVVERWAEDTVPSGAITSCDISPLNHEVGDNSVED
mmetsp:Transcript_5113/g.18681  ORF Transcript_5113/g.18681 Transcript_5113/m.18681 type:complete len:178 (-) Transcript_5113:435-968(-)